MTIITISKKLLILRYIGQLLDKSMCRQTEKNHTVNRFFFGGIVIALTSTYEEVIMFSTSAERVVAPNFIVWHVREHVSRSRVARSASSRVFSLSPSFPRLFARRAHDANRQPATAVFSCWSVFLRNASISRWINSFELSDNFMIREMGVGREGDREKT